MTYATSIACEVGNLPRTVLTRLQATLRELALSLEAVPAQSSFWRTLEEDPLVLDVEGWHFTVEVGRERGSVAVIRIEQRNAHPN